MADNSTSLRFGWFALLVFLAACVSPEQPVAPTGSTLRGYVRPANALATVTATGATGGVSRPATVDTVSGLFTWNDLPAGSYSLDFDQARGYDKPLRRIVNLPFGKATQLDTLRLCRDGQVKGGTVTWIANDTAFSATRVRGLIETSFNNTLLLTAETRNGSRTEMLDFKLQARFTGPGTYALNALPQAAYSSYLYRDTVRATYTTSGSTGGTLVVDSYDACTGAITGTFAFTATDPRATPARQRRIRAGRFALRL
ncbi:carboxypeptidase regulatory-like domain-containing protein [Hymenobacter gummosus]|uniref:Carboxypeptidase regulatory-like domain-containing protein n=1 Tax=Hymenobacter gummosus TaxID=1776032 RepID=A0A431U531_9BACT|nr:DUF6252 family protein [Hymenobacter gummosus]RTQ51440.1 carboxypeptidase regulatory-like domain-containing protein [Hymenobacter gummosus]